MNNELMKNLLLVVGVLILFSVSSVHAADLPDVALEHMPVCTVGNPETPRCHAHVKTDHHGKPQATTAPTGLSPLQIAAAYNLTGSSTKTVAIVDAYNDPNVESDLAVFSNQFGLAACTKANGCLTVVNQNGGSVLPITDSGWALEISLDVQAVHGVCPTCKILLVEANSNSYADLMTAVDWATAHADVVSNSYGSNEFSSETLFDSHFNVGKPVTFSSGDSGFGVEYPAASRYVTAVGGTTLNMSGNAYLSESVWNGAGSGCSSYETKPGWQHDSGCFRRTVADVSAVADPNTGLSVYDTVPYSGQSGWFQVGGTSLASPVIAATYALAPSIVNPYTSFIYGTNMRDITSGTNGHCRRGVTYLCTARIGYDGPSGLGTPLGTGAF